VVWHHSLLLMNGFKKTEASVFSCRLCFLRAFPVISLIVFKNTFMDHCIFHIIENQNSIKSLCWTRCISVKLRYNNLFRNNDIIDQSLAISRLLLCCLVTRPVLWIGKYSLFGVVVDTLFTLIELK